MAINILTHILVLSSQKAITVSSKSKPQPCEASPWRDHLAQTTFNVILITKHVLIRSWDFSVPCGMPSLHIRDSAHVCGVSMWGVRESPPVGRGTRGSRAAASGSITELCCECCQGFVPYFILKIHSWTLNGTSEVQQELIEHSEPRGISEKGIQEYSLEHSWAPASSSFESPISYVNPFIFWNILFLKKMHSIGKCPECSLWWCVQKIFPKASEAAVRCHFILK